ncbi:MAG: sugar phosphate nucleotidyltransferase, partial [Deltaproteobacteria bacterium]
MPALCVIAAGGRGTRLHPRSAHMPKVLIEVGYKELPLLDIDHVNVGAYIRNTLTVDKNMTREDALFDIYRVMRPGEPPTVDTAEAMFRSLF